MNFEYSFGRKKMVMMDCGGFATRLFLG